MELIIFLEGIINLHQPQKIANLIPLFFAAVEISKSRIPLVKADGVI
jgi:hypothetical protein